MKETLIFLGGVAVGVAAGVAVGMYLASDKDAEGRTRLKECLKERGLIPHCKLEIVFGDNKEEQEVVAEAEAETEVDTSELAEEDTVTA